MSEYLIPENPNLIEVPATGLLPGMFVAQLDRPWLETPFSVQGFMIRDRNDADYVAKHCNYVYVDPHRKVYPKNIAQKRRRVAQPDSVSLKIEFEQAKVDFDSAAQIMEGVLGQVKSNRRVDLTVLQSAINPLIDSVLRNRDAMAALVRMKSKGDYFYAHSLATAVWATIIGRHMGLEKVVLRQLALGAAIMDVGMADVPSDLLDAKRSLTETNRAKISDHVKGSLRIVRKSGDVSDKVLNIIACHHERHDGSGYPRGLAGNAIPILARIAGLADSYDAMLNQRPHSPALSSFNAVQELVDNKDILFQETLIEHFVQAVGMFPTGCVVELSTGEVGVVVEQNQTRRLRPKVVVILDEEKRRRDEMKVLDLSKYAGSQGDSPTLWIAKELETGAHGISPNDYFL